jgi:pimeloyl-ACP methyl ester carboxylesterase
VLLHGFDASLRWWQPSVSALARSHRVVRIDLLGHGGSAKPRDGYSMSEQARLVDGVMRILGVRRAIVAGHSMGAAVAIALAESDPPLVAGRRRGRAGTSRPGHHAAHRQAHVLSARRSRPQAAGH